MMDTSTWKNSKFSTRKYLHPPLGVDMMTILGMTTRGLSLRRLTREAHDHDEHDHDEHDDHGHDDHGHGDCESADELFHEFDFDGQIHNLIDGLTLGVAWTDSVDLGVATLVAVIAVSCPKNWVTLEC